MKICVLNGSPKGELSVTMQYVHFIQKKFPQHDLKIHNVSHTIKKLERDSETFRTLVEAIEEADGVMWAFPVYKGLVPAQYMRFIERISEPETAKAFRGKYAVTLSTSARVFDHTAHQYLHAVCDDLDMRYVDYYSADYDDLSKEEERARLIGFAENFFQSIKNQFSRAKTFRPLNVSEFRYRPGKVTRKIGAGGKRILIVTDSLDKKSNLGKMVDRFSRSIAGQVDIVDLQNINMKGGCLGCLRCWYDNVCVYRDGFQDFFESHIKPADIIVTAATVKGRFFSYKLKELGDRCFFNHHRPCFNGKQMAEIVSGPYSQLGSAVEVTRGSCEFQHANYVGSVSDECEDSKTLDHQLQVLAEQLIALAGSNYIKPVTFLGLGAHKIMRDLTWSKLRSIMPDDHQHHKENRLYDFPYKDYKSILLNLAMAPMIRIPAVRKEITQKMATMMLVPYQRIVKTK